MPCEPGRVASPPSGVTRTVDKLSDAELAERKAKRAPAAAAAEKRWRELAKKGDWDQVRMPKKCFRFAGAEEASRRSPEYKAQVLTAVGLVGECAGYSHLGSEEPAALMFVPCEGRRVRASPCEGASLGRLAECLAESLAENALTGMQAEAVVDLARSAAWSFGGLRRGACEKGGPEASIVRGELESGVQLGRRRGAAGPSRPRSTRVGAAVGRSRT